MNDASLDETIKLISESITYTMRSPEQMGAGMKEFGKQINEFNKLSDREKAEFWINAFRNTENKDMCEEFRNRHPECSLNAFIQK